MTTTIAVSGKGGTGKTTLVSMMLRCLIGKSPNAILAVDADPNACLGITLGVEPEQTIADLRDAVVSNKPSDSPAVGKLEQFRQGCEYALTESKGFDLLTMGRPEGPKCYCAANNALRGYLDTLSSSYGYVLTDNEAGMEHLSRRTTNNVDVLFIVGEPTRIGKVTAQRIVELTDSLPISIGKIGVIWNKAGRDVDFEVEGADFYGTVPADQAVMDVAYEGKTIFDLAENSDALSAMREILAKEGLI